MIMKIKPSLISIYRLLPILLLLALPGAAFAQVLVQDVFNGSDGALPDAAKYVWSGQLGQYGTGLLYLSTDAVDESWLRSIAGAAPAGGQTLDLKMRVYAYAENWTPGVYGDGQPRGLRVGNDANNAVEFYSLTHYSVGLRLRKDGVETLASYDLPSGVDIQHDYEITVTTTSAVFKVDGIVAGTFTNSIPTGALNVYADSWDGGGTGNVPIGIASLSLSLINPAPPVITSEPKNLTVNVNSDVTFNVLATGASPISYQWNKDGGDLAGATNADLTLTNVQTNQAGNYTVLITNAWGSVTSRVAVLTVSRLAQTIPGTVVAWGRSSDSQTDVPAGLFGVTAIAAGYRDTVALKGDGTVVTWGYDSYGQTPVPVGLSNVQAIAAGELHTVALKRDGTVVAWGDNGSDQINVPAGLSGIAAIAAGDQHTVALKRDGTVVAWGNNDFDQTTIPIGLSNVQAIAAGGNETVALKCDGTMVVWGDNTYGQAAIPVGLSNVQAIAAGRSHTVALKRDGTVIAWGRNGNGQTNVPAGLSNVQAIAAGSYHTVILKIDGTVVAWGDNDYGQTTVPVGLSNVTAIAAGGFHTVALVPVMLPGISGFTPASGPNGTSVVISGTNFSGITNVQFDGMTAPFTNNSATLITAIVPPGATNGLFTVFSTNGIATSSNNFVVTPGVFNYTTNAGTITITGYIGTGGDVIIPDTSYGWPVTSIDDLSFSNHTNLTSVTIGNNVTRIGNAAFNSCTGLTNVTFPNSITSIGYDAFYNCTSLTGISIPNSVTSIGDEAFSQCTSLKNVAVGNGINSIGRWMFGFCSNLTSITIPNSVTRIDLAAFCCCIRLPSITIPNGVTSIGSDAFSYCTSLASITIPNSVVSIADNVFNYCISLTSVYFKGNAPTIGYSGFYYANATAYYLPGTTNWDSNFGSLPTVLWNPQAQTRDASFGVTANKFGFNITGSSNLVIVVEASTNLANPVWTPVSTNTLNTFIGTNGTSYFCDPCWTNHPGCFYRLRSP